MRRLRPAICWLAVLVGAVWGDARLPGREPARPLLHRAARIDHPPYQDLSPELQARLRAIADHPNLTYAGKPEDFIGEPSLYYWLLDHPDHASQAWRKLGTPCMLIADRGQGRFGYADPSGSDLWWETVHVCADYRIWHAEGKVRPVAWLPPVPLRAVVVFHHTQTRDQAGRTHIRHRADVFAQTDSRTAALVLRLMGPSVPSLSEQCVSQLGLFFSGLVRYFDRYPERTEELLFGKGNSDWLKSAEEFCTIPR